MPKTMLTTLAQLYGCDPDKEKIDRALYKSTECGASVTFRDNTATIHSIVEGSDAEFSADPITFTNSRQFVKDWREAIAWIEGEVDAAWHEANDDDSEEE